MQNYSGYQNVSALLFLSIFLFTGCVHTPVQNEEAVHPFQTIRQSHIDANVPEQEKFNEILTRDLHVYFMERLGENISVSYELLREGPSQNGVAYPKYYAFVVIKKNDKTVERGAVRLAAIEKTKFEVTDYLTDKEIQKNPQSIYTVFPKSVCENIEMELDL